MDKSVFESLFNIYYEKLVAFAYSYLQNRENAKEIVQNSFVKLWESRNKITANTNINSYLFTMVKNGCLDFLKHEKVKLNYANNHKQLTATLNNIALRNDGATAIIRKELSIEINKAIDSLPESSRRIFIKSKIDNLKNKEIAEELKISIRTVENQLYKASKIIKEKLKHLKMLLFL